MWCKKCIQADLGWLRSIFLSSLLIHSHYAQFNTRLHRWYYVPWLLRMRMGIWFEPPYCAYNFFLFLASAHVVYPHFVEQDNLYKWCSDIMSLSQCAGSSLCSYDWVSICVNCYHQGRISSGFDLTFGIVIHIMLFISANICHSRFTLGILAFGLVLLSLFLGAQPDLKSYTMDNDVGITHTLQSSE